MFCYVFISRILNFFYFVVFFLFWTVFNVMGCFLAIAASIFVVSLSVLIEIDLFLKIIESGTFFFLKFSIKRCR